MKKVYEEPMLELEYSSFSVVQMDIIGASIGDGCEDDPWENGVGGEL